MTVDARDPKDLKKEKKRDKKRKAALAEDGEHKKKKRQRDEPVEEPVESLAEEGEHKKKKKKKKQKSRDEEDDQPSEGGEKKRRSPQDDPSDDPEPKKKKRKESVPSASAVEIVEYLTSNNITLSIPITPILSFEQLPSSVPDEAKQCFAAFKAPTPIQACTWPAALDGKDVVGIAETGSGKTLAFGLPALARIRASSASSITALVVSPTRELALQTHETLHALLSPFRLGSVAVFGGVGKDEQIKLLKKGKKSLVATRVIVGTPGRILDLVNSGDCDLSGVDYLVLDEADRMLDKGFENDIRKIISYTKQGKGERQTMMFSATWPESVRRLASSFQSSPIRVTVGSDDLTANSRVEQMVEVFDDKFSKDQRLLKHLRSLLPAKTSSEHDRVIIFALYKAEPGRISSALSSAGYAATTLHGDMAQSARLSSLEDFKAGRKNILIATDVAARGLDIPDVKAVVNYSFPLTVEDYVHRIGRTGRGGRTGKSITFFTGHEHERALAGELARLLHDSVHDVQKKEMSLKELEEAEKKCGLKELRDRFPMTIKKKSHSAYGAFFREDVPTTTRTKIVF